MRHVEINVPNLLVVRIYHDDFRRRLNEVERLEPIEMKAGNAGVRTAGVRCKSNLSCQHFRIVLLHALYDPRLENWNIAKIGNKIGRLLAGCRGLWIADARMGGITAHRTGPAGDN